MNSQPNFPTLRFDNETSLRRAFLDHRGVQLEVFLQGAHVARFQTQSGAELLFLSRASHFEDGKPIRGGVPLIFPWFGAKKEDADAPMHGFARTMEWQIKGADDHSLRLKLESSDATRARWPYDFRLEYCVAIEAEKLRLELQIHNTGAVDFEFETALHTYFQVSNARDISIDGLEGKTYLDKTQNMMRQIQRGPIQVAGEVNRIYLDSSGPITLRDGARTVRISDVGGVKSSVVWNPFIESARTFADLGDDEWQNFVCIESGVVADDAEILPAGKCYEMAIEIEIEGAN